MTTRPTRLTVETQRAILGAYARRAAPRPLPGGLDAEDLAQEAWLRLAQRYDDLDEREAGSFCGLARAAVRNLATDALRRSRFEATEAPEALPDHGRDPGISVDVARLGAALSRLDPAAARFLLAVEDLGSVPAAQRDASWPPRSPYYHLSRLHEALRDDLGVCLNDRGAPHPGKDSPGERPEVRRAAWLGSPARTTA